jgi:hypothetical protein
VARLDNYAFAKVVRQDQTKVVSNVTFALKRLPSSMAFSLNRMVMPFIAPRRQNLVLVFSWIRSGSTLLTELLANHPDIVGYGETHIHYTDEKSIYDLNLRLMRHLRRSGIGSRYVLDKVLFDHYIQDLGALVRSVELSPIFLLRHPAGNTRSIRKMMQDRQIKGSPGSDSFETIWARMRSRHRKMGDLCDALPAGMPIAAVSYERLISEPDAALGALTRFLQLERPLSAEYVVTEKTGRWGVGDGSDNIKTGKIQARTSAHDAAMEVPPDVMEGYAALCAKLEARARFSAL